MRTSEEIYHRVRWDPRFDPARFVFGVEQRGAAVKRVPLPDFVPGDIPWHRVRFIEADGVLVWDRATGVDLVDSLLAGRADEPRLLRPPLFAARTPHVWDPVAEAWRPASAVRRATRPAGTRLRVLTWNTLWDRFNSDRIETVRRRPLLLDALRDADADVIALQEVERGLLEPLLRAAWVRDRYFLGTDPAGGDVPDTGLLLLSRVPVREAGLLTLGPHKAVAAVTVETAAGPLVVAGTHLTSDHSADGAARRRAELAAVAEGLATVAGDVILLGDFNDGAAGPDGPAAVLGLRDAWTEAHGPHDQTPTFDPATNPLAAISSLSGRAARLDRVLLRSRRVRVAAAALLGDRPVAGRYLSDHYGVLADLELDAEPVADERVAALASGGDFEDDAAERELVRSVVTGVAAALGDGAVVHVTGSRRMGCALPGADLDLVAVLPGDEVELAQVRRRVTEALPEATRVREVVGARVPGLRFAVAGLGVDLALVPAGPLDPAEAVRRRAELGETAALALSAVSDAEAVLAAADDDRRAFARLARVVKAWARARGLDAAPFGGLPGLAWAVLAVLAARDAGDLPVAELPRHFFATWAAWDWREPIALVPSPAAVPPASVTVLTPSDPVRNCAEQVGPGGRDLLIQELYEAWEILDAADRTGENPWPALLAPPPLHRRHAAWALLTVRAARPADFDEVMGRVRGRMRALLTALAESGATDAHAWPRPFDSGPAHARYAIGLGQSPPSRVALTEIVAAWRRGLAGVQVEFAGNGQAPALR